MQSFTPASSAARRGGDRHLWQAKLAADDVRILDTRYHLVEGVDPANALATEAAIRGHAAAALVTVPELAMDLVLVAP
jgi:hypothetical protein